MRNTGISAVGEVPWGTHLCLFYETREDLLDTLAPFFKAGLESGEFCMCMTSAHLSHDVVIQALRRAIPDFDRHFDNHAIEIVRSEDYYLGEGAFDRDRATQCLHEKLESVLARGFTGMRANGDEGWLSREDWPYFSEYESELSNSIAETPMIILCAYDLAARDGAEVLDVARHHEVVIAKRNNVWDVLETASLKQTKQQLENLSSELERRVLARTSALEYSNRHLQNEIAERKRIENELIQSEERFATAFRSSPVSSAITGLDDCRFIDVNEAFLRLFGYSRAQVIGRTASDLNLWVDSADQMALVNTLRKKGAIHGHETRGRTKSGETLHLLVFLEPIEIGGQQCVLSLAYDQTAREQAERALRESTEKIAYLSHYDDLTGLPKREPFQERLSQSLNTAKRNGGQVAVIMIDIRRFRPINDTFGRCAGDALLRDFAGRMKASWPQADSVARNGGNTFAGMLVDPAEPSAVAHALEAFVNDTLESPFLIKGAEFRIAITAGIAQFPSDAQDAEALMVNAEAALLKAKASGERYLFYQPEMNSRVAEALRLENRLRRAVDRKQFVLHYQPKIECGSGRVSGFEALIRWHDPEGNLVPPAQFIPALEETGMILDVGRWGIRSALADGRAWHKASGDPLRVAVNISALQLQQRDFVDGVRAAVAELCRRPCVLDLEITESLVMRDIDENISKLRALNEMGIRVAIDDFGTGYSSLSYLAQLPVYSLKIDRSFVNTMTDSVQSMTIVSTIISLAHSLGMKVTAEGVETEEQAKLLKLLRCDELQGYFFGRPMAAQDIPIFLEIPVEDTRAAGPLQIVRARHGLG
jgi:diguanylate cyclase (GGDEF)-like protein/PAS domain S-box-containing protein